MNKEALELIGSTVGALGALGNLLSDFYRELSDKEALGSGARATCEILVMDSIHIFYSLKFGFF